MPHNSAIERDVLPAPVVALVRACHRERWADQHSTSDEMAAPLERAEVLIE
jgi:hypothetical protein